MVVMKIVVTLCIRASSAWEQGRKTAYACYAWSAIDALNIGTCLTYEESKRVVDRLTSQICTYTAKGVLAKVLIDKSDMVELVQLMDKLI